jgi:hypothetical protein
MSGPDAYQLSKSYMDGLSRAAQERGWLDAVLVDMTEQERAAYQRPAQQPWWDARFAEHLAATVGRVVGEWALEQLGYDVVAHAIGPKVREQLDAALAGGAGPEALFAHLEEFAVVAVRPLSTRWTLLGAGLGRLELIYPRALERETQVLWRGAIRYAFELSRREGKIVEETQAPPGHLSYRLEWR